MRQNKKRLTLRKKRRSLPSEPVVYPSGVFVHTERGYYYIVSPTKRFRITTERILNSWSPKVVIETTEAAVAKYRVAAKMKFRNGSLLYSQANGKMYLVSENKVRHITNPDILTRLNLRRQDAVWVSDTEIKLHEEGEPLN